MRSQLHGQISEKGAGVRVHTTIGAGAPYKRFAQQNLGVRRNSLPPRRSNRGSPWGLTHGACTGTPEEVAQCEASYTGKYLKKVLA